MIHEWTRYWTKPDGQISLADRGFLVGPDSGSWLSPESPDLWTFEDIAARRCLVCLGEPVGKSETLRAEAARMREECEDTGDHVLQVDLGSTREESVLEREIFKVDPGAPLKLEAQAADLRADGYEIAVVIDDASLT